jgi:CDP-glucose 4,6-dehydratase
MNLKSAFWAGKRVFVTGHTGFKGSWLCLWLQDLGATVTGFALPPPTNPSLFEIANVAKGMTSIIGDIRDASAFSHAITTAQPEIVIHMAAQPLVRYSYENPVETYSTNVMGLVNVLEAIRKTPSIKAVVNVTTDKCYENREWDWGYRENEALGGHDPYSSSKGCAELVSAAYRQSYCLPIATARAGNVIGGGDWADDRLIPDILRSIEAGQPVNIRNPHAIRPWQHVLEPLSGYLALAQNLYQYGPAFAEAWNFGPRDEDAKPVQWIVENLTKIWGEDARWQLDSDSANHPHEAHYLKLECSKAKAQLGWKPRWDLSQALEKIMSWHQAFLAQSDMKAITLQQIQTYSGAH